MKKVLVVAFDFPPRRTSGVYRPTGLSRYLPRFGWLPTVLSAEPREGDTSDPSLLEKIPREVKIWRTASLNPTGWEKSMASAARSLGKPAPGGRNGSKPMWEQFLRGCMGFVKAYLYFPDRVVGWVPFASEKAMDLMMSEKFDIVYTTSPPQSTPLIGLFLKMVFGVPWVAEFRDPWLQPPSVRALFGINYPPTRRRLESWLNVLILQHADTIVTVTKGHAAELRESFELPAEKVAVVSNGFDECDFQPGDFSNNDPPEHDRILLSHFGTIYPHFSGLFFKALEDLLQESSELKQRLRIDIIGYPTEDVLSQIGSNSLKDVVRVRGFINHGEALRAMRSSDGLLLFYANRYISSVSIPGKAYEYLRVGRPILAVTFDGGLKDLVESGCAGLVVRPDDRAGIREALSRFIHERIRKQPSAAASHEFVAQFRYDRLAGRLATVFEETSRHAR